MSRSIVNAAPEDDLNDFYDLGALEPSDPDIQAWLDEHRVRPPMSVRPTETGKSAPVEGETQGEAAGGHEHDGLPTVDDLKEILPPYTPINEDRKS